MTESFASPSMAHTSHSCWHQAVVSAADSFMQFLQSGATRADLEVADSVSNEGTMRPDLSRHPRQTESWFRMIKGVSDLLTDVAR